MKKPPTIEYLIGHKIQNLRLYKRESQADLARILHVTRPVVSNLEAGRRPVTVRELYILARHFRVSIIPALIPGLATAPSTQSLRRPTR